MVSKETDMSWEYTCPKCKVMLNPDRSVILEMARDDVNCMIGLHPQPGKYEVFLPPHVYTEDGTRWEFSCPMCKESLTTEEDLNLCELELKVEGSLLQILFSCVAGEHATFIVHDDTLKERYGKDANRYRPETGNAKAEHF